MYSAASSLLNKIRGGVILFVDMAWFSLVLNN
jgi:hypothetical protein